MKLPRFSLSQDSKETYRPFKSISSDALGVELGRQEEGKHLVGGRPTLLGSTCPNCHDDLTRFFSLDLSDGRLQLQGLGLNRLEILYCWPCQLSQSAFSYQPQSNGQVKLLEVGEGPPVSGFPYPNYPRWFSEKPIMLMPMPEDLQDAKEQYAYLSDVDEDEIDRRWDYSELEKIEAMIHQFGGVPFLYEYRKPSCVLCSQEMSFLCTVENQSWDQQGFVGTGHVQVVYFVCLDCAVVTARNECD